METEIGSLTAAAATQVVAAYLKRQSIPAAEVPAAVLSIAAALATAGQPPPAKAQKPAADLRRLVKQDAVTCAECGLARRTLKRHLAAIHDLTPEAYRAKWGLPHDHPMVSPSYSARRSELAKEIGLGSVASRKKRKSRR